MLLELYVTFGVGAILLILFNKKFFGENTPPLSTELMNVDPMELCPLPLHPPKQTFDPMSEDESSSEDFMIKEKFY